MSESGRATGSQQGRCPPRERRHLGRAAGDRADRAWQQRRLARRVAEHLQAGLGASGDAGPERLEPEGLDVDPPAHRGVRRVEQLEAAVDEEAVDPLGPDPPADGVSGLEHHDVAPGGDERLGAPQPREPGTHDHHVCLHTLTLVNASTTATPRGDP